METNATDAKCESARRDAAGDSRVIYAPRPDATPEGELAALAAVYALAIQATNGRKPPLTLGSELRRTPFAVKTKF